MPRTSMPRTSRVIKLKSLQAPAPLSKPPEVYGGKPYLPIDYNERKAIPICTGVLDYFPLALLEIAKVSYAGNQQHNSGEPLHWARGKSTEQIDTAIRHIMERGNKDTDNVRHLAKAAWRILAALQIECEQDMGLPISRGSWEPGK